MGEKRRIHLNPWEALKAMLLNGDQMVSTQMWADVGRPRCPPRCGPAQGNRLLTVRVASGESLAHRDSPAQRHSMPFPRGELGILRTKGYRALSQAQIGGHRPRAW